MAGKFKILFVLCLVAPCLAQYEILTGGVSTIQTSVATTTTEAGVSTTQTSVATTTTEAGVSTTQTPGTTTTTEAGVSTTQTSVATTTTEAGGTTTQTPGTTTTTEAGGTTTGGTGGTTATTESPDACASNPCDYGSTCDPRFNKTYVCLCWPGEYYNDDTKSCKKAKVFPGELNLSGVEYFDAMNNKKSPEFTETAEKIVKEVSKEFDHKTGFTGATVLELQPLKSRAGGVKATLDIIYKTDAKVTESDVKYIITKTINATTECKDCALKDASFQEKSLCDNPKACDNKTATCKLGDGEFSCTCKESYIKIEFSERICIACPSGQKKKDATTCTACPFGYSGLDCSESWQLVLVIVGSILGGLLLVTLILLSVVARTSSKKSSKKSKEADIGMSQVNQSNTKTPMVTSNFINSHAAPASWPANSFASDGMMKIPRAASANRWDSRGNLDVTLSNSRQNLIPASRNSRYGDDYDDDDTGPYAPPRPQNNPHAQIQAQNNPYAQPRPQDNPYAQNRPQNNPYAQARPQNNPYASSQGQANPYFADDVGRRY